MWMILENIRPNDRSQTQPITHNMTTVVWNGQDRQIHRDRQWISDVKGLESRDQNQVLVGVDFLSRVLKVF
jgi:hypothetical protein